MALKFIQQVLAGKSIGRILFNRAVEKHCRDLSGRVVDLAGGVSPSYRQVLPTGIELVTTEYQSGKGADIVVDLNRPLPFADASESTFLCFNAIYILEDRQAFFREVYRALAPRGRLFLSSPFMTNEMPEPHDYIRLTREGLEKEFRNAGFTDISITAYGERATAAAYLLHPLFYFSIVRLVAYAIALFVDRLIPLSLKIHHPAPIGYFVVAKK